MREVTDSGASSKHSKDILDMKAAGFFYILGVRVRVRFRVRDGVMVRVRVRG